MVIGIYQTRPEANPELGWTRVATVTATGGELHTDGDARLLTGILKIPARDPDDPSRLITSSDDADAWAAALPAVLRGPQLIARVEAEADAAR